MRKEFEMAMRSPGLAALSGCGGILVALVTIFRYILPSEEDSMGAAVDAVLLTPMMLTLYTGPYILRGFRLLVMYNPRMRKRWGAFVREPLLVKAMVNSCVVLEAIVWTASLVVGIQRVTDQMFVVYLVDTLFTIGAIIVLFGKLRKTDDLYQMSTELQKVGAFAVLALASSEDGEEMDTRSSSQNAPDPRPVGVSGRGPAGGRGRQGGGRSGRGRGGRSVVSPSPVPAVSGAAGSPAPPAPIRLDVTPATVVETSTPLADLPYQASLMFLLDVEAFSAGLEDAATDSAAGYERCDGIVHKYIREGSPFEVNIESKTRTEIVRATERKVFMELTLEAKGQLLNKAAKEIEKMLADNLYDKFRAFTEYKNIEGQLFAPEELGGYSVSRCSRYSVTLRSG
eukprot:g10357.t1